ncbi:MAG: metallophosphoesterase [Immundisolibacter sp.]|uniref:metallophosphoesterase family protein n=1 Tax=Immundisolibacter sp. TaxID=1934948 RepID=UPI0019837F35|nr:metallophosphoesterase [Immundisolibacter sp.]MBC7161689.1 metallophosphoesterase [Immundisolibacter sp.]
MRLILHLSDTHFGTERPAVVAALTRLAQRERPDIAVLSGDVTQRARRTQFAAARRFVQSLEVPVVITLPGNHDIPLDNVFARLGRPYARYLEAFDGPLSRVHCGPGEFIVALNSTRWYRHIHGTVSRRQLQWSCDELRAAPPGLLKLVVTHHPVYVPRPSEEHNLLRGHREALAQWAAAGADLILGGHIHLPSITPLAEARALSRSVWSVQAGTAVSSRVRWEAPNSVNLLRYDPLVAPGECCAERWNFSAASDEFELAEAVHMLLAGRAASATAR